MFARDTWLRILQWPVADTSLQLLDPMLQSLNMRSKLASYFLGVAKLLASLLRAYKYRNVGLVGTLPSPGFW